MVSKLYKEIVVVLVTEQRSRFINVTNDVDTYVSTC